MWFRAGTGNVCVCGVVDALPKLYTKRINGGHEDLPSCKAVLEAYKFLPVLKWTSESEYFLSFKFFCRHYNYTLRCLLTIANTKFSVWGGGGGGACI